MAPDTDDIENEEKSDAEDNSEASMERDDIDEDELDADFQKDQKKKKNEAMDEEDGSSEFEFPGKRPPQDDEIKNELEKVKPRLAMFKCVGIGLKNHSREMA